MFYFPLVYSFPYHIFFCNLFILNSFQSPPLRLHAPTISSVLLHLCNIQLAFLDPLIHFLIIALVVISSFSTPFNLLHFAYSFLLSPPSCILRYSTCFHWPTNPFLSIFFSVISSFLIPQSPLFFSSIFLVPPLFFYFSIFNVLPYCTICCYLLLLLLRGLVHVITSPALGHSIRKKRNWYKFFFLPFQVVCLHPLHRRP